MYIADPQFVFISVVEDVLGVICSSVPYLPALFRRHSPKISHITYLLRRLLWSRESKAKERYDLPLRENDNLDPDVIHAPNVQVETHVIGSVKGCVSHDPRLITP